MGYEVVFTETYRAELEAIVAYLKGALGTPPAAAKLLDSLEHMIDLLAEMPELWDNGDGGCCPAPAPLGISCNYAGPKIGGHPGGPRDL